MRHAHIDKKTTVILSHHAHWHLNDAAVGVLDKDAGELKTYTNLVTQHVSISVCDTQTVLICTDYDVI